VRRGLHFIPAGASDPFPGETVLCRPVYTNPSGPVLGYEVVPEADSFADRVTEGFDDFLYEVYDAGSVWVAAPSGVGAGVSRSSFLMNSTERPIGMVELDTGTTNVGRANIYQSTQGWLFGQANIRWACRFAVRALSTVGEEFHCVAGFHDAINGSTKDATNGIYFKYDRLVSGNFWVATVVDNGSVTNIVTTIAPVANVFQVLEIEVLHETLPIVGTPSAYFRIDGVHAALHPVGLPTANGRVCGEGYRIVKTAGLANRFGEVDWRRHRIRSGANR